MSKDEAIEATGSLHVVQAKPNYNVSFHNDWKMVGQLDFNGDVMTFEGDADESAKVFIDFIAMRFEQRLKEERAKENEACAKLADNISDKYAFGYYGNEVDTADEIAAAIRERVK